MLLQARLSKYQRQQLLCWVFFSAAITLQILGDQATLSLNLTKQRHESGAVTSEAAPIDPVSEGVKKGAGQPSIASASSFS